MLKRALLIGLFSALFAVKAADNPRIDSAAVTAFNQPWQDFIRRYAGCEEVTLPKGEPVTYVRKCYLMAGFTDLESFRRAREAAKTLFGLR